MTIRPRPLLLALTVAALAGVAACGDDASVICDKVYETCAGALVDSQGLSISRESCIRLFDDLAAENGSQVSQIANCAEKAACSALAACFAGSGVGGS